MDLISKFLNTEVAEDQVAVKYASARPNNMFDFNKKKLGIIKDNKFSSGALH